MDQPRTEPAVGEYKNELATIDKSDGSVLGPEQTLKLID